MDRFDPDDSSAEPAIAPAHTALLTLHQVAGSYDGVGQVPEFGRLEVGEALASLAEAPAHEASVGLKLDTLVALARADFPDHERSEAAYLALGEAIGAAHGVTADQVLSDAKAVGLGDAAITATVTGAALPHHATAFVGQDVCDIRDVTVDGIPAVWIFSEFETDAPYSGVSEWVRPENWPKRGPAMFKGMHVVGDQPTKIAGSGYTAHWHGVYLEDVQLVERLKTLLHCDYFEDAATATGVTYRLDFSVGHQLTVDRGFLLAEDLGSKRRVKALKIVAFADQEWNEVAKLVCPFWTDFVRQAAEGGTTSSPSTPGSQPAPTGSEGGGGGSREGDAGLTDLWTAWIDFIGESAKAYASLAGDATTKMAGGSYGRKDLVGDGAAYWRQLAKDWAQAWAYGAEMMTAMAQEGLVTPRPPGAEDETGSRFPPFVPPGGAAGAKAAAAPSGGAAPTAAAAPSVRPRASGGTVESVNVPVPGLAPGATATCTDLTGIEAGAPVIPNAVITASVAEIGPQQYAVRLAADVSDVAQGLYTGEVVVNGTTRVPVTFYVSRARSTP